MVDSIDRPKILLVDDHADTTELLGMYLERRGFDVASAGTVAGAIEVFSQGHFDAVVSDLRLPDGTGLDLIRKLRSSAPIRAIALSGSSEPEDIDASKRAGFDAHLVKPVPAEHLAEMLRKLIRPSVPSP
jgi:CheY-like chemotaxis protein